jgi:hypothetical protein
MIRPAASIVAPTGEPRRWQTMESPMKLASAIGLSLLLSTMSVTGAHAALLEEHVTGGVLDLVWKPGLLLPNGDPLPNVMHAATLAPSDPAYANPSGDHTVAVATNSFAPDSGGVILTCTDPGPVSDYSWEAWMFTGAGNTRRGLVVRADPSNAFQSCYQFVIQSGLFQLNFRKLVNTAPTTLATWFATSLPAGSVQPNTWHKMKVVAVGNGFQCFWDGFDLTGGVPIVDASSPSLPTGWVGAYNFRFDLGDVPVYFDDFALDASGPVPARSTSWGAIKARYAN